MGSERDYDWAITQTDAYLAQMQSSVPETAVDRTESVVTDLDEEILYLAQQGLMLMKER